MELCDRIAVIRKAMGLTQEQLGELVGVSRQAVSKWEAGQTVPDALTVAKLCQALHVSADYVLLGKEPEEEKEPSGRGDQPCEPPEECPVCGRKNQGNICQTCGYAIPETPPKGGRYAVVATGGWMGSVVEESHSAEELEKYCGFTPESAKAVRAQIANYGSFMLLRRGLDDRAAQWLTAHLSRNVFQLKIVEDCGEPEETLLLKNSAMELPPAFRKEEPMGFGGTVLAVTVGVILALLVLSFF